MSSIIKFIFQDWLNERKSTKAQLKKIPVQTNFSSRLTDKRVAPAPVTPRETDFTTMEAYAHSGYLDTDTLNLIQEYDKEQILADAIYLAKKCCNRHQIKCYLSGSYIYIETGKGKWYFEPNPDGEVTLYHKNYQLRKSSRASYHVQFTKNMSINSIIRYIAIHDGQRGRKYAY